MKCKLWGIAFLAKATLLSIGASAAQAKETLLFNSEREIPLDELLDLLDIVPGVSTTATVSNELSGTYGATADLSGDGRLSCRAEGDDVVLAAGDGPSATGTCHARVCTTTLALVTICDTTAIEVESAACLADGPGYVDPGCDAGAPVCTGSGASAHCVGCLEDSHCGIPSGTFGLGLGQVANVTLGLLNEVLGLDAGIPLSTVQVGAAVNGPFSDRAVLDASATCEIAADGSVDLIADAETTGTSTCYVEACVPLLGSCLVIPLDIVVDACLIGGDCYPIAVCDSATNTCETCRDDEDPGYIDSGCSSADPVCNEAQAPAACVECTDDVDCTGKLLTVAIGPQRYTLLELSRITDVLRLGADFVPSTVRVGATADGPFSDEAVLDADGSLSECSVDADGNVFLAASGVEGEAVCYVEVCATVLGNTVESCITAPIDVTVDECVLDRSCDLSPRCDAATFTCGAGCRDDHGAGQIDSGCDSAQPVCDGTCIECQQDADCAPKHPVVDLDLTEVGEVALDDILASLNFELDVLIDSIQVGATLYGPFQDVTTLDVQGDVAQCMVDLDGNVELIATTDVYGQTTCYVEVCAAVLESVTTCAVLPIEINVDPCAADDSCLNDFCDVAVNECEVCIDNGDGIDLGCSGDEPLCIRDASSASNRCVECEEDSDCGAGGVCDDDNTCDYCIDDTVGGIDSGCDAGDPACDESPVGADNPICVECTVDQDCPDDDVCDLSNNTCVECLDDGDCPDGVCDLSNNTCVECLDDGDCPDGVCDLSNNTCVECLDDNDCPGSDVCDLSNNTCVECLDDNDCPGTDVCDPSNNTCVECLDDNDCPGDDVCNTSTETCVECLDDDDCPGDDVCDIATHTCEPPPPPVDCADDTAGGVDTGCNQPLPACDENPLGGGDDVCVECTVDADCPSTVCDEATRTCEECADTQSGNAVDAGCQTGTPMCLTGDDGDDHCYECDVDDDCPDGVCVDHVCEPCSDNGPGEVDAGCGTSAPACDEAPPAGGDATCVECTDDEDCVSDDCDEASRTCEPCQDTTEGGVDAGCGTALPACDEAPPAGGEASCVECTIDADCPSELCDEANRVCLECEDTAAGGDVDDGCDEERPVCADDDGAGDEHCVECTEDAHCDGDDICNEGSNHCVEPDSTLAVDDRYSTAFGVKLEVTAELGVLANDTPAPGTDGLVAAVVVATLPDPATEGELLLAPDGGLTFTPVSGFSGRVVFEYTATSSDGEPSTARVVIDVGTNQPPTGGDETVETDEDVAVLIVVLANDQDPEDQRLTVTVLGDPLYGTVELLADDTVIYRPAPDFHGHDAFDYTVCDAWDACSEATVSVTVLPVNDAPRAANDFAVSFDGMPLVIDVLANDGDVDGDVLHVGALTVDGLAGSVVVLDGAVVFTPEDGFVGLSHFVYEACDDGGLCDTALVTVQLGSGEVVLPTVEAFDDVAETGLGVSIKIDVLANDIVHDGTAPLEVAAWTKPSYGLATLTSDGMLRYTPEPGFVGDDVFTYTACSGEACDAAFVTVTVGEGDNHPPTAIDDVVTTVADVALVIDPTANDQDPDDDPLVIVAIGAPSSGQATLNEDGQVDYQPAPGFVGTDTFWVEIGDGNGGTDRSTVTVIVVSTANYPPVAVDDQFNLTRPAPGEDGVTPALVADLDVLANDSDPDGDRVEIDVVIQPSQGSAVLNASQHITYTANADFVGLDYVIYRITDGRGGFDVATATISVRAANGAPAVVDDAVATPEDTPVRIDVLANDSDPEGEVLAVEIVSVPDHGTVVIDHDDGSVTYSPGENYHGDDRFEYEACDSAGQCGTAEVAIQVTPVNDAPVAEDDHGTMLAPAPVLLDVLANDSDVDGDALTVASLSDPDVGEVTLEADGRVAVSAPASFSGVLTFTYEACDGGGLCDMATVTVDVTAEVLPPVAQDDVATTVANVQVVIDVLANDSDPQGDTLAIDSVTQPGWGTAHIVDGKVGYLPQADFVGSDNFQYVVCDLGGLCDQASVAVTVTVPQENHAPICSDDVYDASLTAIHRIDVLANDVDPDGDVLRVVSVTQGSLGTVHIGTDNRLVYDPDAGALGEDHLTYTACDRWNVCDEAQVTVILGDTDGDADAGRFELAGGPTCANGGGSTTLVTLALGLLVLALRRARGRRGRFARR